MLEEWLTRHPDVSLLNLLLCTAIASLWALWRSERAKRDKLQAAKDAERERFEETYKTLQADVTSKMIELVQRGIVSQTAGTEVMRSLDRRLEGVERSIERDQWRKPSTRNYGKPGS